MRETEIAQKQCDLRRKQPAKAKGKCLRVPKRLRGRALELIRKLQIAHLRCSYNQLLQHYCPLKRWRVKGSQVANDQACETGAIEFARASSSREHDPISGASQVTAEAPKPSFFDLATPHANVSAFCRAAVAKLLPNDLWGGREMGLENKRKVMNSIDKFVKLRRHDPMSLHEVFQGLKVRLAGVGR